MENSHETYDRQTLINLYYSRDLEMDINNTQTIINALSKLGYYNINTQTELYNFYLESLITKIKNEFKNSWSSSIRNKTINELLTINSNPALMARIERSHNLSCFLTAIDTFEFYNNLTLEELNYIGY